MRIMKEYFLMWRIRSYISLVGLKSVLKKRIRSNEYLHVHEYSKKTNRNTLNYL